MSYKHTVNLPRTPFPMRADLLERQERILRRWQAQSIYRALAEERRDARPFVIHDGPPYAAGTIHVGIGMNKILKDVAAKFQVMNDRRLTFVPGWDCHGLPIELEALSELGEAAAEATPLEIRDRCERAARRYVDRQKGLFELLGIFADWERPYLTMDPVYESAVLTVLAKVVAGGYVYRDLKPLAWCVDCRHVLADTEIEYRTVAGPSIWVRFTLDEPSRGPLAEKGGLAGDTPVDLLAWTTTPWSLPGNAAAAVHPERDYGLYRYADADGASRAAVVVERLAPLVFEALGGEGGERVARLNGGELVGLAAGHPLFESSVPVVAADYVSDDSGSGVVHIAPAHGAEDFQVGRDEELAFVNPLGEDGVFGEAAGPFAGLDLEAAAPEILAAMRRRGTLAALGEVEHEYPHCDRCGTAAITRATRQWFVDLEHRDPEPRDEPGRTLRERALVEVEITRWTPEASRERIRAAIESRPDWCISRQRVWGVPIPAVACRGCGEETLDPAVIGAVRDRVRGGGSRVWFERPLDELLPDGFACPACGGTDLAKGGDVLDVWFESGSSWQPVLVADHRGAFPADLLVEGSDQHRGWFQMSLLPAVACRGRAPYRQVFTHGFVLNEARRPMSKVRGDLVTLDATLEQVPADLVRLFFTRADAAGDLAVAAESFAAVEPIYRHLRNAFRYLLGNLFDFVPRRDSVHSEDLHPLDLWAVARFHHLVSEVTAEYEALRFHRAVSKLHDFVHNELSQLYFDIVKDRLYCEPAGSPARHSAQTALHSILVGLVKLLAPILPYTTEEVWELTPGHGECSSVHLSRWPKSDEGLLQTRRGRRVAETFERFRALRDAVKPALERARDRDLVGRDADAVVEISAAGGLEAFLGEGSAEDLRDFLKVSQIVEAGEASDDHEAVADLDAVAFQVRASESEPCVRCRLRQPTVGDDPEHPELCARCVQAVRTIEGTPEPAPRIAGPLGADARPADVAAYLRQRDLRKVALLNEEGFCQAWALDPPSQEVRPVTALQPLADHINASPDFRDHAGVLLGLGRHTDVLFGIGLHHLNYGTPLGGTREYSYRRVGDLIDNLLRLSWGMSIKNAVAELPHGGGKSIIDPCGWDLKIHREFRREIYRDFGQFTASLFGRYIAAEDVGNTNADTREMLYACRHVMCLSQGVGGSGNPSRFTSLAAWAAAKAGWKFSTGTSSFSGLTVALQGAGNVARNFVAILLASDPDFGKLLVADRDPEQIQVVRNLLLKAGRDDALEVVSSADPERSGRYVERPDERGRDYVLYAPSDILVPAAVGNVIGPDNVDRLGCKLIVPIANNVYSSNDEIAARLDERGILDVVENNINWGGALAAASEIFGYDETNVTRACIEAYEKTLRLLEEARERDLPPWEIVKERAERRIYQEVHPAVRAARGYKFIGDVSADFAHWIKEKWLRNRVDVAPQEFPRFAVELAEEVR